MMIRYTCRDMGLKCGFVVKGNTIEEVTKAALAHIKEKHADEFNAMNSPAQVAAMEKALARSTRVVPE